MRDGAAQATAEKFCKLWMDRDEVSESIFERERERERESLGESGERDRHCQTATDRGRKRAGEKERELWMDCDEVKEGRKGAGDSNGARGRGTEEQK